MKVWFKTKISTVESELSEDVSFDQSFRLIEVPSPDYSKIELNPHLESQQSAESEPIEAIIKVSEENYLPAGIKVRARISSYLFTAELLASDLERLEKDPCVVSISVSRGLRSL